jgi:hypothetical protein
MPQLTLEQMLKAEGYTDADLEAVKPLLTDQRLRGSIEKSVGAMESQLSQFREENDKWADWAEKTNKPQLTQLQQEKLDAISKAGSLEARLKALDPTFTPTVTQPAPEAPKPGEQGFDPKKMGLVTVDDVNTYAAAQGEAIAMANDLAQEYFQLTGKSMLEYKTRDSEGRERRGMTALLHEARTQKKHLPDYISEKFDFAGKRSAEAEKQRLAAEKAIRDDERAKLMGEMGNPNSRPLMPSSNPFIPARSAADGKQVQPWEIPAADRRNQRIQNALQTQAKGMVQ